MRSTNDNPTDPLGGLGPAIRKPEPPKPDPVKPFEAVPHEIADHSRALETVLDTLRRKNDRDEPTGCDLADDWHLF